MPLEKTPPVTIDRLVILLVDDDAIIRMGTAARLVEFGFAPIEARHAAEAVAVLQTAIHVDLVFSDVRMPGTMDGFGLRRWMRVNRAGLPMLLTSGDVAMADLDREQIDATCFFEKPYDIAAIVARARSVIAGR
jgi:DNA-binding NtrC family response regulator